MQCKIPETRWVWLVAGKAATLLSSVSYLCFFLRCDLTHNLDLADVTAAHEVKVRYPSNVTHFQSDVPSLGLRVCRPNKMSHPLYEQKWVKQNRLPPPIKYPLQGPNFLTSKTPGEVTPTPNRSTCPKAAHFIIRPKETD